MGQSKRQWEEEQEYDDREHIGPDQHYIAIWQEAERIIKDIKIKTTNGPIILSAIKSILNEERKER